jgi:hypothetical protein
MPDPEEPTKPDSAEQAAPQTPPPSAGDRALVDLGSVGEIPSDTNETTIVHTPPQGLAALAGSAPRSAGSDSGGGPRVQADAAAGEHVGDYQLIEEIARGGMGVVYKARHTKLGRLVALKMIRAVDLAQKGDIERFNVEAMAAAQLEHPNIVPIYDWGEHVGRPYYTMRLIEGGNLSTHLPALRGRDRAIVQLLTPVARAVHHAHQHGILHRDLKPANILLGSTQERPAPAQVPTTSGSPADESGSPLDLVPFVTDFGLAKRFDIDTKMTQSGAVMGTPAYISPEQASGVRGRVSTASDVYALGAILYEALTGRPPFTGSSVGDILHQVLETEPARPRSLDPAIDRDLETICLKCLEKDPARRYQSAADLADDLQRWSNREPIEARPTGAWERAWLWGRRRPAIMALLGILATVTIVAFVTVLMFYRKADQQAKLAREAVKRAGEQTEIAKRQTERAVEESLRRAEAEQVAKVGLEALGSLAGTTGQAREVIQQLWSTGNLRSIGQAIEAYEKQTGTLPPPAIVDRTTQRPLLSWRVALLPYLGLGELYKRFQLDQPWDSPHNRALAEEMPSVYRVIPITEAPSVVTMGQLLRAGQALDPTRRGLVARMPSLLSVLSPGVATNSPVTYYRAIVGPETLFDGPEGRKRVDEKAGPEPTILIVEAGPPVVWTKPEEIEVGPDQAMPRLVGPMPNVGLLTLMADGTVRTLRPDVDPRAIRRRTTRRGDLPPGSR